VVKQQKRVLKQKEILEQQKKDRELLQKKLQSKFRARTLAPEESLYTSLIPQAESKPPLPVEKEPPTKSKEIKHKKQHQDKVKKVKKLTIKQAGEQIESNALQKEIKSWESRFPANQDIQLKCFAEYMENAYKNTAEWPQKVLDEEKFSGRAGIPARYLSENTQHVIRNWFCKKPVTEKVTYFWFLLQAIATFAETKSEFTGIGLKVALQLLLQCEPQALWGNLDNIRQTYLNRGKMHSHFVPFFVWMLCQTLLNSPLLTLIAWYEFLLPVLGGSSKKDEILRDSTLSFLEHFLENKNVIYPKLKEENKRYETEVLDGFERLTTYFYSSSDVPERLNSIFPELSNISKSLITRGQLFSRFLAHAATENSTFREVVLETLVVCLRGECSSTFSMWVEIYPKLIAQSNNLLLYILLNWEEELSQQINREELLQLVNTILKNNKLLLSGTLNATGSKNKNKKKESVTDEDKQDIIMCTITCKALRKKVNRSTKLGYFLGSMSKLLPIVAIGSAVYLFYSHCCDFDTCRDITPFCIKTAF